METSASTDWVVVGHGGKPRKSPSLTSLSSVTGSAAFQASAEVAPSRTSEGRIPPVFVTNVRDVIGFVRRLRKVVALADNASVKLLASETVRVTCRSASEHFGVVQWLERESFQFHTYTLNRVKPVAVSYTHLDVYKRQPMNSMCDNYLYGFCIYNQVYLYFCYID